MNGAKGEKGDPGEKGEDGGPGAAGDGCSVAGQTDSTVTIKCGDVSTTISLKGADRPGQNSSIDFYGKGFFLKGTEVYRYELSDGRTLKQTESVTMRELTRDDGFYKYTASDETSQYSMLVFDGYYRNAVTNNFSNAPISLKLMTDMRKEFQVNANVLSHLECERIYYLVTREKLTFKKAKQEATYEIMNQFFMDTTGIKFSEAVSVFGSDISSEKLLALTVILQGERSEAEFKDLLTEISTDITEDGEWNNLEKKIELAEWARGADKSGRLEKIRDNIVKGTNVKLPNFIKYIRNFWMTVESL